MAKKKLIVSKYGQWKYPGQETIIPNVNGRITMRGVPYPVLGIDDLGNQQMMMPGAEYKFPGNSVYEIPMANRNIMDRGFDRGSGNSTGVNWPTELTNEQRALDDWQKLTSNGRPTFEKRIPAPDDKTYQQLLSRSQGGPSSSDKGMFLGHFQFKDGGLVRMQPGGSVNPNFKPSYDWRKSPEENAELNKRAEAAGHNSVAEYEKSGWAWQPEKTHFTQGEGQSFRKAKPQAKSWEQQIMQGIPAVPPKAKSKTTTSSSSLKADLKKMNQDLISGSAVAESTFAEPRIPIHWVNNTAEGIKAIEAEWERVRQEGIAEERAKIQADNAEINKRKQQFAQEHLGTDISQVDNYEKDNNTGEWAPKSEHTKQLEAKGKEQSLRVASENAYTRNINTPTMEEGLIDLAKQAPLALIGAGLGNMAVTGETGVAGLLGQVGNNLSKGVAGAKNFVKPAGQAWNTVLNAPRFGNNALTLGNAFKTLSAYDLSHKYIPNTIDAGKMYYETGDTKYLKDMGYNALKGGLELSASMGPFMHEMSAAKKPVSLVDDARKMTDADKDVGSRTLSGVKTFKNTLGYMKEQGGGVFLGKFKQVGGQLVPHDTDMGSFQKGGQPIHVYSKNDPAYKKYLKQKAYYDQQKAIYENAAKIQGRIFKDYDELVEQSYKNAKAYKEKFDPDLGIPDFYYTGLPLDPNTKKIPYFGVRKPAPVILEKEVKPKAIDIKPLPMPPPVVELKPVLQNIQHPQTNKQRVVINTPQGDKIRVQDIKTKKFLGWEDDKGLPSDVENPSGTASQDFPQMRRVAPPQGGFAYGGDISKDKGVYLGAYKQVGGQLIPHDISVPNLSRQDGGGIDYEAIKDPELAARARAMGHNTIAEYRDSNWGYGKNMQQPASANTAPIAGVTGPPSYILPTLEIKGTKSTPNKLPYKNVDTSNSEPVPKFLEPGFQDELSYLEAKNKLRLRQEVESAQARFEGGEDIFSAIEDRDKAENALNEMYKKYPNDKRLTAKETEVSQALGKFMVQQAIEKGIFKGLPLISANQKYLDILQSLEGANNIKNAFDIQDVLDSKQRGDNKYAYYTEELKDKVDAYEKAHGTYQPGLMDKIQALMPNKQDGGDMPFGLPLKEQNIYTLPEYNQPRNPKTGEILPDPRRPNLGMDTGATEYKYTYGTDEGDIDIPSIVAGQYIGDQALDRYNLTGERFKTMTDPGSYSNFYDQISQLGLMQEKQGGAVKRVKIKSLPKNWKSQ